MQEPYYSEGDLHGFQEKFYGVGIIFDTFKNTENLAAHRDVTILVNDGEKTYSMMTDDVQGCSMNMRYHSDRADFLVTDSSRAKVEVNGTKLVVSVDAKGTGYWEECYKTDKLPLSHDWAVKAHLGVTATTGQLADNHDVLSLLTYGDSSQMEDSEAMAAKEHKALFELSPAIEAKTITQGVYADNSAKISEYLVQIQDKINFIMNRLEFLDHHMEHEFASIDDNIDNLVGKLEKRESTSETRLESLEDIVKREIEGSLNERLENIEKELKITVERKVYYTFIDCPLASSALIFIVVLILIVIIAVQINRLENNLDKRIETAAKKDAAKEDKKTDTKATSRSRRDSRRDMEKEKSARRESSSGGGGGFYKWMFWLLLLVIAGGSAFFYNFYQKNIKGFKLP